MLEHAVELGKINLSEDDPDVLRTAYQLGAVLRLAEDPAGARRVLEEAYAAGLWRLGDSDPLMLEISHDIGLVAEELGNRHEARKAFGRVAELGPAALGGDHWAVARARAYLGHDQNPVPVRAESAPGLNEPTVQLAVVEPAPRPAPVAQPPQSAPPQGNPAPSVPPQVAAVSQPRPLRVESGGPGAQVARPAPTVQPPPPDDQLVWVDPARVGDRRGAARAIEEPTVAQPIIAPRNVAGEGWPPAPVDHYPRQVTNADPAPVHVTVHELMASADQERGPDAYRKGLGLFAAIAGGLAAVIAVAALVFVLASRSGGAAAETDVPTLGGPPPTDVQLRDSGSGIEVRWQDPSEGTVSFMVTMGHPGEELKPITTLGPGQTSYELGGLNPSLNYCFAVIAVYRSDQFATSPQSCTSRASATPR